jgi:lipoteichoic acid synthase
LSALARTVEAPARRRLATARALGRAALERPWFAASLLAALAWAKQLYAALEFQRMWPQESPATFLAAHPELLLSTLATSLLAGALVHAVARPAARWAVALGLDAIVTFLSLADVMSVVWYGNLPTTDNLTSPAMMRVAALSIVRLVQLRYLLLCIDLIGIGLAWIAAMRLASEPRRRRWRPAAMWGGYVALAGGLLAPASVRLAGGELDRSALSDRRLARFHLLGPVAFHLDEMARPAGGAAPPSPAEEALLASRLAELRASFDGESPRFGAARGSNLVLISAESLQAFPLGLEVEGAAVTPHLDRLASESLVFSEFFDQTHFGTTSDGEFMVLNSLHPAAMGHAAYRYGGNAFHGLPRLLAARGYHSAVLCAAHPNFWNMGRLHAAYGFATARYEDAFPRQPRIGPWLDDAVFLARAAEQLATLPRPFFAFLLTGSNHHPYSLPPEKRSLRLGALEGSSVGDYLQSVHYVDRAFGGFVDALRTAGLLDSTVVALYGDHQGYLGEPPELRELLGVERGDELRQFEIRRRLPFLVRLPSGGGASTIATAAGHLDVAPTLLGLLGEPPGKAMLGRDLLVPGEGLVVLRDGGFVADSALYRYRVGPPAASRCLERPSGARFDCGRLAARRTEAVARLRLSDALLDADLVARLAADDLRID